MELSVIITVIFFLALAAVMGFGINAAINSDEEVRRDRAGV